MRKEYLLNHRAKLVNLDCCVEYEKWWNEFIDYLLNNYKDTKDYRVSFEVKKDLKNIDGFLVCDNAQESKLIISVDNQKLIFNTDADIFILPDSYTPKNSLSAIGYFMCNNDEIINFSEIDISNVDTSRMNNMQNLFYNCSKLNKIDLYGMNTKNVKNMRAMFSYCSNLTSIENMNFNTSKVLTMNRMFFRCEKLKSIDVSKFDTSNVIDMQLMFTSCNSLKSLDCSNFKINDKLIRTDISSNKKTDMFLGCPDFCLYLNGQPLSAVDAIIFGDAPKADFNINDKDYVHYYNEYKGQSQCHYYVDRVETYRGIKIGDSINDVLIKYGKQNVINISDDNLGQINKGFKNALKNTNRVIKLQCIDLFFEFTLRFFIGKDDKVNVIGYFMQYITKNYKNEIYEKYKKLINKKGDFCYGSGLSMNDFTLYGKAKACLDDKKCNHNLLFIYHFDDIWIWTFSGNDDIETYRGIKLGSDIYEVINSYGSTNINKCNVETDEILGLKKIYESDFKNLSNSIEDGIYLEYQYDIVQDLELVYQVNSIRFYFGNGNKVKLICFYGNSPHNRNGKLNLFSKYSNFYFNNRQYNLYDRSYYKKNIEILDGLKGEINSDIKYLQNVIKNEKNNIAYDRIVEFCGKTISKILINNTDSDLYLDLSILGKKGLDVIYEEVNYFIDVNNFNLAKKIILPLLRGLKKLEDNNFGNGSVKNIYCEFESGFEKLLYDTINKNNKTLCPSEENYSNIYYLYGKILKGEKDYKAASDALNKALNYAYINSKYYAELSDIFYLEYKETGNEEALESFYNNTKQMMKVTYQKYYLSICYEMFAKYFKEKKLYNQSVICYILSIPYSNDYSLIESEFYQFANKYKNVNLYPTKNDIQEFCKKYNIPKSCDPNIQKFADDLFLTIFVSNKIKLSETLKKSYFDILTPIISDELKYALDRIKYMGKTSYKNVNSENNHTIYELNDINKVKVLSNQKFTDIDELDTIKFGMYNQKVDTITDIEWILLDINDDKALLLSKYILDCEVYDESEFSVSWEDCSLRKWLNTKFYKKAFSKNEQNLILDSNIPNNFDNDWEKTKGNNTQDKVFCLSVSEIEKYFNDEKISNEYFINKNLAARATAYCIRNSDIHIDDNEDNWFFGNSCYWTRSCSKNNSRIINVNEDGSFAKGIPSNLNVIGVRPAIWVKLN